MTGETWTQITAPPRVAASPDAEVPPSPGGKSSRLVVASGVGVVALLLLGLLLWVGSSGRGPVRPPKDGPNAGDLGPSARVTTPDTGRPPAGRVPPVDKPPPPSPEGKPKPPPEGRPPASTPSVGDQPRLKLLVPAYFYPAGPGLKQWEQLIEAGSRVPIVAVANPATGPGEKPNPDYNAIVGRARRRGVTVVGYVGTNYAHRPLAEVKADVDRWARFYPEIGGIFFDAQASEAGHADYYVALRDHAREKIKGASVITNPGTICAEEYASRLTSVVLCLFSSPAGFEDFRLPRWAERHPSGRFGAMPTHVASPEQMRDCIQVASSRGIGLIYVTDAQAPVLWDRLPPYWDAEVEAVREVNAGRAP